MKSENYRVEQREIAGVKVNVTTYKIGERYYCHITNVDPGGTFAREEGESKEESVQRALARAQEQLLG